MKSVSAAELYTRRIQEQKVTLHEAWRERKLMNQVIKDQIKLQNMQVASWSKNPDGKIVSDAYIPDTDIRGVQKLRTQMALYNQVLGSVADNTIKWGKNTQWAGRQLTVGFTVPLAMAAAATGKFAYDMDKALTQITKVYGDATQEFQETSEDIRKASWNTAQNMTKMYGQSAADTLEITAQLAAAGSTGIELQNATAAATKARMLNEIDLQTAIQASITMQTAYKMSGEELGQTWDYINAVANQTVLSAEDFATAIPKVGGLLQELGADAKDLGVFMTAMVAGGIDAAEGANALKSIAFRAVAPYDKAMETFNKNTGANLKDLIAQANGQIVPLLDLMIDKMRGLDTATKTQVFKDVFGIHQGNKALILMEQLADETGQVAQAMAVGKNSVAENAIIANQELARMNAQPYKRIEKALNTIKNEMAEIGEAILPPLATALEKVSALFDWVSNMDKTKKQIIIFSALLVAAAGPILMLLGLFGNLAGQGAKLLTTLGGMILRNKALTPEQKAQEILGKKVADAYNMQADAATRLTAAISRMAETTAMANGISLNALTPAGWLRKTDPSDTMVYGPTMPGTTQGRGPNGRFQKAGIVANGMTAAQLRANEAAYQQSVLAAAATHKQNAAIAAQNKLLEEQKAKYAGVASKVGGVVATTGFLASMFGPEGGMVSGLANTAFLMGTVASMSGGLIAKAVMWGKAQVASVTLLNTAFTKAKVGAVALGAQLQAAALPLTAIAAAVGYAWYKAGQEAEAASEKMKATVNSTEQWASILGYNRIDPGSFAVQKAQTEQDVTSSAVNQLKSQAPELYKVLDAKEGKSIGEKWAAAVAQGAQVRLSGGTEDAAREAVKTAMAVMNSGLSNVEIEARLDIDFTNMGEVARARVTDLGNMLDDAVKSTGDGRWDKILRTLGPDAYQLTDSAKVLVEESNKAFTEALISTPVDQRGALIDQYVSQFTDPLDAAYAKAGKKMGVSRDEFIQMLRDHNEKGMLAFGTAELMQNFTNAELQALTRGVEAYDNTTAGLADLNNMSEDIKNGRNLDAVAAELKRLANNAKLVDGTAAAKQIEAINEAATDLEATLKSMGITTEIDVVVDAYKDVMSGVQGDMFDFADEAWEEHTDSVMAGFDAAADGIQAAADARQKAMEGRHEKAQDALEKRQQATQDRLKDSQEAATKKLEADQQRRRDAETAYYDNRIKKIEEAIDAEEKAEDIRQKLFEAERERIRRYSQMFSQNVDLNSAISTGNFDEAAKIANDMQSQSDQWALDDAQAGNTSASEKRIEALNSSRELIDKQKDQRLKALDAIEKAEDESLRKRQENEDRALRNRMDAEKKSLAHSQQVEKDRLDSATKAALAYNEQMKKFTQQEIEIDRKGLEKELENLRRATPQNEAQLKEHHAKVQQIYDKFGLDLSAKGTAWSGIIGTSLKNHILWSTTQIANDKAWATAGSQIASALLKGGFGMSPSQVGAWLNGGPAPAGSVFAGPSIYSGGTQTSKAHLDGRGSGITRHKGGMIDNSKGSRAGHSGSSQNPSEVWVNALKGESVLNRKATDLIGEDGVNALNKGEGLPPNTGPWGADAGFAGVAGVMAAAISKRIMSQSIDAIRNRLAGPMDAGAAGKFAGIELTPEQLSNAGIIMNVGRSMGATNRDLQIALMTAMQESSLKNLRYGDRDSLGLFQQRPSQGWGTIEQILNPEYASRKFFSSLFKVKDRNNMPLTVAAQKVQRSAFPNAYAKWENLARAILMNGAQYRGFGAGIDISNLMGLAGMSPTAGAGGWVRPAAGRVSSEFGMRWGRLHDGIDIANAIGTPLYAARSGVVTQTRFGKGVGNYTQIDHGNGYSTGYAHQSKFLTSVGSMVQAGQRIGLMGNTGNSTGPHLHFRYIKDGIARNPRTIMPQLAQGGYTLNEGLANLHPRETVLTAPLSEDLKSGLNKFGENGGGGNSYKFDINLQGAYISSDVVIERAVSAAIEKKERKTGQSRIVGNR